MDYKNYKIIQVMKKSDRAEISFAAVDGLDNPVVVKHLQGANADIYRAIARIQSPHIPKIHFMEEQEAALCIVEEYIDGRTLDVYLAEENLTDIQKLELGVQLCEALEALHQESFPIIHRDIKPSNILITGDGVLKIIDFDASRQYKTEKNTSDTRLLGTIEYAAPEQFGYTQTDVRSDVYSIGVVFSEIEMEKNAAFLKEWKRIIDKCTSFAPENRYGSVSELKKKVMRCIRKAKDPLGIRTVSLAARQAVRRGLTGEKKGSGTQESSENGEFVFGYKTESVSFSANQLTCVDATAVKYQRNVNNSVSICFERFRGELILEFPNPVYLKYCTEFIVKMKNEVGKVTIKLYDASGNEAFALYTAKTQGVEEVSFRLLEDCAVTRIGFMADEDTLTDYSNFETIFYGMRFFFLVEETEVLTCWFNEMMPGEYYNADYYYLDDGRLHVTYADLYGELRLTLPQPVDMSRCVAVKIRLKSRVGRLMVKLYDAAYDAYHAAEEFHDVCTFTTQDRWFLSSSEKTIVGVGLMTNDMDIVNYSEVEATLMHIEFYMKKGN